MSYTTPIVRFEISGQKKLTDEFIKEEWLPLEKMETEVILNSESSPSTSGWVDVKTSAIDVVNKVVINAPDLATTNPDETLTVRFVIDNGTDPEYNVDLDLEGLNVFAFPDTFGSYIKEVKLKTTAESNTSIPIRIISI